MASAAMLIGPAAAQASEDLSITQKLSAKVVKPGALVTIEVTVTNEGTEPPRYGEAIVNLFSLSGYGQPADNPYQSFSPSQGSCVKSDAGEYQSLVCQLGDLAPGASAQITVVVRVNQTMNHLAALLPTPYEGGYEDDDNRDNESVQRVTASVPPRLTGSKKIVLKGLPTGCVSNDFTLKVIPTVPNVKKVVAVLFLGFDDEGEGQEWKRTSKSGRLTVKVPVTKITERDLGKLYKLKLKARVKGKAPLKRTVEFQLC